MRNNQPVTQKEHMLKPGAVLVSRTDAKGRILHGNEEFYTVSGYGKEELKGKPHNIIRHPDMPPEAFRDLWSTLQKGRPWSGLVKNRRKNGDYYWVRANVNPGTDGGYRSVRVASNRKEVASAESLYAEMHRNENITLHEGEVFVKGVGTNVRLLLKKISLSHRMLLLFGAFVVFGGGMLAVGWLGMDELLARLQDIQSVVQSPAVPLSGIRDVVSAKQVESISSIGKYRNSLILVAMLGGVVISFLMLTTHKRIKKGLSVAHKAARAMAEGDLTCSISSEGYDELGQLTAQITIMRNNLQELIGELKSGLEKLAGHSGEMRSVAAESFRVAGEQAENSSSIAAAVEELSVSIDSVEVHAADANELVKKSVATADKSARVIEGVSTETQSVASAVEGTALDMQELEKISGEIFGIVKIIGEVAAQTNLLALNAAIEAARAGEYGRGFAVVADEVRNLAEKTNASSKEIHTMIASIQKASRDAAESMGASVAKVNSGVKLSLDAVESMSTIRADQLSVTQIVDDIASGLSEQAEATHHIASRIEAISQGTELLAVKASRTNDAAEDIEKLINELGSLAGNFRVA